MYRKTIVNSDLLLSKAYWWSHIWKPYRNLSEEVRVLKHLEADAIDKAKSLTHSRIVAETNVKMDMTVLSHQLLTNSTAHFEFPTEPSILEEKDGVKYTDRKQDNKQGASSNKGGGQQGKSASKPDGERSGNEQHSKDNNQQAHRKGQGGRSLLDLLVSTKVH